MPLRVLDAIPMVDCAREQRNWLLMLLAEASQCYKRIEPHRDGFSLSGFCGPRFDLSELTPSTATIMGIGHSAVITCGILMRHDFSYL